MSGFQSLIPLATAGSGASDIASALGGNTAQSATIDAQNQDIAQRNALVAAQQAQQDQQQRNLLEQQQATARAQMGAWGTGGDGGSADAILQGMAQRSADSIAANDQLASLRMRNPVNLLSSGSSNGLADGLSVFQSFYGGSDSAMGTMG
jgi:hypothetical protein